MEQGMRMTVLEETETSGQKPGRDNPGILGSIPEGALLISSWASFCDSSRALLTAATTRSSSISASPGLITSFSIWIFVICCLPFAVTFTIPPPDSALTVLCSSSACACAIFSCIFCTCFIIPCIFGITIISLQKCVVQPVPITRSHAEYHGALAPRGNAYLGREAAVTFGRAVRVNISLLRRKIKTFLTWGLI